MKSQPCSLTLHLASLAACADESAGGPPLPALQTLLSKGTRGPCAADGEAGLLAHFALEGGEAGERALAALCALGAGLGAAEGYWLRVDPVHLEAGRDEIFLSYQHELELQQAEADELLAALNRVYAEDGWHFSVLSPQHWLLQLPRPVAMQTSPTALVIGHAVRDWLPRGEDAMDWQRVMNEVEMLLHASEVNARRGERGALAVNGLWFWGGGSLPAPGAGGGWAAVVADDYLARGLARLHGLEVQGATKVELERLLQSGGRVLWVESSPPSYEACQHLERQCFAPLLEHLGRGELAELVIEVPGLGRWTLEPKALRRWWRRSKPLKRLLGA